MKLAARISEEEWEKHKDAIFKSYMELGRTLAEVRSEMSAEHQFEATCVISESCESDLTHCRKGQYTTRFKHWGFTKNRSKDDWRCLDSSVRKRKLDSSSAVILNGTQMIPARKVARQIARHRPWHWERNTVGMSKV